MSAATGQEQKTLHKTLRPDTTKGKSTAVSPSSHFKWKSGLSSGLPKNLWHMLQMHDSSQFRVGTEPDFVNYFFFYVFFPP